MATLWTINPSRRKKRRSGKRRSAKQRAATRKMLAARFGANPRRKRHYKRRAKRHAGAVARVMRKSRRSVRRYARRGRRGGRGAMRLNVNSAMNLLKAGAIGGAGAVLVDIGMGQAQRLLPAMLATPTDAQGNVQYGYFATKAALAMVLGTYGAKVMPAAIAEKMAEGSLTVLAYQFMRPMVPAGLTMGYLNPAPTMRPSNVGRYVSGAAAYARLPVRGAVADDKGGRAANVLNMVNVSRKAA